MLQNLATVDLTFAVQQRIFLRGSLYSSRFLVSRLRCMYRFHHRGISQSQSAAGVEHFESKPFNRRSDPWSRGVTRDRPEKESREEYLTRISLGAVTPIKTSPRRGDSSSILLARSGEFRLCRVLCNDRTSHCWDVSLPGHPPFLAERISYVQFLYS